VAQPVSLEAEVVPPGRRESPSPEDENMKTASTSEVRIADGDNVSK
jgi:hypothetical protein